MRMADGGSGDRAERVQRVLDLVLAGCLAGAGSVALGPFVRTGAAPLLSATAGCALLEANAVLHQHAFQAKLPPPRLDDCCNVSSDSTHEHAEHGSFDLAAAYTSLRHSCRGRRFSQTDLTAVYATALLDALAARLLPVYDNSAGPDPLDALEGQLAARAPLPALAFTRYTALHSSSTHAPHLAHGLYTANSQPVNAPASTHSRPRHKSWTATVDAALRSGIPKRKKRRSESKPTTDMTAVMTDSLVEDHAHQTHIEGDVETTKSSLDDQSALGRRSSNTSSWSVRTGVTNVGNGSISSPRQCTRSESLSAVSVAHSLSSISSPAPPVVVSHELGDLASMHPRPTIVSHSLAPHPRKPRSLTLPSHSRVPNSNEQIFDALMSSDQTRRVSLTPKRLKSMESQVRTSSDTEPERNRQHTLTRDDAMASSFNQNPQVPDESPALSTARRSSLSSPRSLPRTRQRSASSPPSHASFTPGRLLPTPSESPAATHTLPSLPAQASVERRDDILDVLQDIHAEIEHCASVAGCQQVIRQTMARYITQPPSPVKGTLARTPSKGSGRTLVSLPPPYLEGEPRVPPGLLPRTSRSHASLPPQSPHSPASAKNSVLPSSALYVPPASPYCAASWTPSELEAVGEEAGEERGSPDLPDTQQWHKVESSPATSDLSPKQPNPKQPEGHNIDKRPDPPYRHGSEANPSRLIDLTESLAPRHVTSATLSRHEGKGMNRSSSASLVPSVQLSAHSADMPSPLARKRMLHRTKASASMRNSSPRTSLQSHRSMRPSEEELHQHGPQSSPVPSSPSVLGRHHCMSDHLPADEEDTIENSSKDERLPRTKRDTIVASAPESGSVPWFFAPDMAVTPRIPAWSSKAGDSVALCAANVVHLDDYPSPSSSYEELDDGIWRLN